MVVFLFLLVLLAIAGLLGVVLKAVAVIVVTAVLTATILGWWGWRALKRQLAFADARLQAHTDVRVGEISRRRIDEPPSVDERY